MAEKRPTLRDGDIATARATRRGALVALVAVAAAALPAAAQAPAPPATPPPAGPTETDSDSGPPGQVTGFTDRDRGKQADPPGNGRGTEPRSLPVTDFDSGPAADRRNRGRGGRGLGSDNDSGARADPVGQGRRKPSKR